MLSQSKGNFSKLIDKKILNRRKRKLDEMLMSKDNFFTEEAIKQRDPILYEIYVGSYKRRNQKYEGSNKDASVASFLMEELDRDVYLEELNAQLKKEELLYGENEIRELYVQIINLE